MTTPIPKLRILLVEDADDDFLIACEPLQLAGHDVVRAKNLTEALLQLSAGGWSFVLCDPGLPDVVDKRTEAPRRLQDAAIALGLQIPIIPLSGNVDPSYRKSIKAEGFEAYLSKEELFSKETTVFMKLLLKEVNLAKRTGTSSGREAERLVNDLRVEFTALKSNLTHLEDTVKYYRSALESIDTLTEGQKLRGLFMDELSNRINQSLGHFDGRLNSMGERLKKIEEKEETRSKVELEEKITAGLIAKVWGIAKNQKALITGAGAIAGLGASLLLQLLK